MQFLLARAGSRCRSKEGPRIRVISITIQVLVPMRARLPVPFPSPRIGASSRGGTVADSSDEVRNFAWYHTLELPGGVVTPGMFDTRPAATKIGMPPSLAGKRCLDVGTSDGFWAFEMERRGAD